MSDRAKGFYRDRAIVELINQHRCLNTEQVQALIFPGMRAGRRKCQQRLKKLCDSGRLKRWRYSLEESYTYHAGGDPGRLEHCVLLNWLIIWHRRSLKSWEELHSVTYEPDYKFIRPDALLATKNMVTGKYKFYFCELDRAWSSNKFDKVQKYNELYASENYSGDWWVGHTEAFPPILIATTNEKQVKKIQDAIKKDNKHGLDFKVLLVNNLKMEVMNNEN